MFSKEIFGTRLKQLRNDKKINQIELAETLGITRTQISDIENGKTTTSMERLLIIADYFNVSTDYLIGKTDIVKTDYGIDVEIPSDPTELEAAIARLGETVEALKVALEKRRSQ